MVYFWDEILLDDALLAVNWIPGLSRVEGNLTVAAVFLLIMNQINEWLTTRRGCLPAGQVPINMGGIGNLFLCMWSICAVK